MEFGIYLVYEDFMPSNVMEGYVLVLSSALYLRIEQVSRRNIDNPHEIGGLDVKKAAYYWVSGWHLTVGAKR
jgi:hypothetical protein